MDTQKEYIGNLTQSERKEYLQYKQHKQRANHNYYSIEKGLEKSAFVVLFLLALSFISLPSLRNHSRSIGAYIVDPASFMITLAAFMMNYWGRKALKNISWKHMGKWLHPKNQIRMPEQIKEKLQNVGDNLYDLLYHSAMWGVAMALFCHQHWFPHVLGGDGECGNIFKDYPLWPDSQSSALVFLHVQLGTYLYLAANLLVFDRQSRRKINYGQLIFHHSVTISLLSISLFFNFIQIAIVMTFLHDFSDSFRCLSRLVGELRISFLNPSLFTLAFFISFGFWIYNRILVLPLCIIVQITKNIPSWESDYWFNLPVLSLCVLLAIGMYLLQCYWAILHYRSYKLENLRNRQLLENIFVGKRQQ